MTIKHMRIFLAVYKTQNITKAAKELHMTQPAVSRAIAEIEQYYGICLFERIGRRLFVTEIGHRFYAQALHMIDAFDVMEKELKDWDKMGTIRVGATATLGNVFLPELITRLRQKYPEIEIRCTVSNGSMLQNGLLHNELDLAFVESSVEASELKAKQIGSDKLVLIMPPDGKLCKPTLESVELCKPSSKDNKLCNPTSKDIEKNERAEKIVLEEALKSPVLFREKGSTVRTYLDHYFAGRNIQVTPIWESVSTQAIIQAVAAGIGISFLPEKLVARDIAEGKIITREIKDAELIREHYVVWHENKFLTKSMKYLIELGTSDLNTVD